MATVKLFDIKWSSHTAGPSPVINEFGPNARASIEYPAHIKMMCVLDVNCFEFLKPYHYKVN